MQALPPSHSDTLQLPRNHLLAVIGFENDQVKAFFNEAILDVETAIMLEEANVPQYKDLGMVYLYHRAI